ncbi:MAG: histidine kinase [Fluviicola sp.]|nr:histidine kinase [Fluviicola sp.]
MLKNLLFLSFIVILIPTCVGQIHYKQLVKDTVYLSNLGQKIEFSGDLKKITIWNKELIEKSFQRMKDKNNKEKTQLFFETAYLSGLLTNAFIELENSNYKKSAAYNFRVIKLVKKPEHQRLKTYAYLSIGSLFKLQYEEEKAKKYFLKCYESSILTKDTVVLAYVCNNLATVYSDENNYVKSEMFYKESIKYTNNFEEKVKSMSNLISLYVKVKKLTEAKKISETIHSTYRIKDFTPLTHISTLHSLGLLENALKNYTKAEELYKEAYEIGVKEKLSYQNAISSKLLFSNYIELEDYKNALHYTNIYHQYLDSIENNENENSTLKAEYKFQSELKESKIKNLTQKKQIAELKSKEKTNLVILIIVTFIIIGVTLLSLFYRFKAKKKSEFLQSQLVYAEQLLEEKQRASESEIKAIKSQMNPHFFYNALNSIQGYVLTGEQQKASESIGLFSELSRAVLESSRTNEISLHDELELLDTYMKLECMRMPKIRYTIDTAEDLRLYDLFLPPMIIQPIVENSVKHGLANKEEGGLIQLRFSSNDDQLIIEIEDDGIGREAAGKIGSLKKRKGSSFSTEANLNRIELLNESFGLAITQEIVDNFDENGNATGTLIRITIPQNNF